MPLALPISAEDVADALFMSVTTLVGFLVGGVIGLAVGLFAGYAYLDLTSRIADLEAAVNSLVRERDDLRERVAELEAARDVATDRDD
ncbi:MULTISPECIES: bZIP transcription factor [Halorubrum]|uniref:Uncharacterized protein n=1 Tax=Halorubrum persicum TaxID=1383844 RepID=A0A2G1WGS0_9EURY|nr:bZIP transcription factor [Halorubrum persicum]PHQ38184.1 hypothetical protein DJ69_13030 [Halorubrum persicum]